jgi:uncharacterized phage protein gp47/JayE
MALSVNDMINIIRARGRGDPPSAYADIAVNSTVKIASFLNAKLEMARTEQTVDGILFALNDVDTLNGFSADSGDSVDTITARLKDALEEIASNYGLTRKSAGGSRGTVLLIRRGNVTAPIQVPAGRRFYAASIDQEYRVSQTTIIIPSAMVYSTAQNGYIASIPVESVDSGLVTIAPAGTITTLRDSIIGIDAVTNVDPIVGGRDIENDESLGDRIKTVLSANNIGTLAGYQSLVLSLATVRDASIVGASDPLMIRDRGDGGSVDIYVTDAIPTTVTEVMTTTGTVFTPARQPVVYDATVNPTNVSVTGFVPTTITILPDVGQFGGSYRAQTQIQFDVAFTPGCTVTYQVDGLVEQVQSFLDDPTRKILGSDVLAKAATASPVDVLFQIRVLSGFSPSQVKANTEAAVAQFLSGRTIGQSLELSDVIDVVADISGVDQVHIPPTRFQKQSIGTPTWTDTVVAAANEILQPGDIQMIL